MEKLISRLEREQALAQLVGESPVFRKAIHDLPRIAKSAAGVLITGETGTGKELVARAIHYLSDRCDHPFVALNCGSMPESLLEEQLFGHERGAFTGAASSRKGLLAHSDRGVLFLDELDSMPLKAQVVLLRVLQDQRFRALGSNLEQSIDVRFLAATNVAPRAALEKGSIRSDLYYRLGVFTVDLPPLRERREDIPLLADHFLRKLAPRDKKDLTFSEAACDAMLSHGWPGNVRELENAVIRAVHLCGESRIGPAHLGLPDTKPTAGLGELPPMRRMKRQMIRCFEKDYLTRLMRRFGGNVTRAAGAAGKDRSDLGKLLRKYGLNPARFRPSRPASDDV